MLDVMRKHSRSFIIYIFFGIIIAVFVVNFGPQSAGCTATTSHAARVEGRPISQTLFNYAMTAAGIRSQQIPENQMIELRAVVMDQLVLRELLADDALDLGFRVSDQEIDDMIVKGRYLVLGQPHPMVSGDGDKFDYDLFSRYVRYSFGLNVKKFKEEQRRELLADKMRQYLISTAKVSEDEVRTDFQVENTQAQLSYVRFSPAEYRSKVKVDRAKVQSFLAANAKRVENYYKDNKTAYQKLPKQVRLQLIQFKAPDPAKKAEVRLRAEAALKRLQAGEAFEKIAETESDDAESKAEGGMLSWRNEDSPGLDAAVTKEIPKLKQDALSGVMEGAEAVNGYYIVKVVGRRQGDLSLDQAKLEIAEELLRNQESLRLAKTDAEEQIKKARAGAKLSDLFTPEEEARTDEQSPASVPAAADKTPASERKPERSPLKLSKTSMFSRNGKHLVPGIGISPELMKLAFTLKKGEVASQAIQVGELIYLVALDDKREPDAGDWTKRKEELTETAASERARNTLREYSLRRCEAALKSKSLYVNQNALVTPGYVPDKKDGPLPSFVPCSSFKERVY